MDIIPKKIHKQQISTLKDSRREMQIKPQKDTTFLPTYFFPPWNVGMGIQYTLVVIIS